MRAPGLLLPRSRPIGSNVRPFSWRRFLLVVGALLLVWFLTFVGGAVVFGAAALAGFAAFAIWRWPIVGLVALVALSPVHQFLMLLVFHFTGTPMLLKMAQIWKEGVVVLLLLKTLDHTLRERRSPWLSLLDLGIVIFIVCGILYLAVPSALEESTLFSKLMGLRADTFFFLAYFIGRGLPVTRRQVRLLLIVFGVVTFIIGMIALIQSSAPALTNRIFESLSFQEFMEVQRGDSAVTDVIRANNINGLILPRASSLLLSDLGLAFYCALALPIGAALLFTVGGLRAKVVANFWVLLMMGTTVLTVTRSAILAMAPIMLALLARSGRLGYALLLGFQIMIGIVVAAYMFDVRPSVIGEVFSPSEGSVQGHIRAMDESLTLLREHPFGIGLGTAGEVAQRFTPESGITNESWYLQIATEMGLPAAALFALILLGLVVRAFSQYGKVSDPWLRALCLGMGGATIGFGFVGITLHVWSGLATAILFWLFAGLAARAPQLETTATER